MAKQSYTEEVLLKVKTDKTELEQIQKEFDDLVIKDVLSKDARKSLEKAFKDAEERALKIRKINKELEALKDIDTPESRKAKRELRGAKASLERQEIGSAFKKGIKEGIVDAGKKAWDTITDFAKDTFKQAIQMMREIAGFSANSSVFSSEATNLKLTYGLSGSEAYAAQMASQDTGFGSFDEFMQNYMFASKETQANWKHLFEEYQKTFEQDEKVALAFQEFETEWKIFKKEMSIELINFFMENKDTIKSVLVGLIEFMKVGLQVFAKLLSGLITDPTRSDSVRTAATSDILSNYSTNNSTNNLTISNTFNGVQASDQSKLLNAGNLTYQQVIAYYEGGQ